MTTKTKLSWSLGGSSYSCVSFRILLPLPLLLPLPDPGPGRWRPSGHQVSTPRSEGVRTLPTLQSHPYNSGCPVPYTTLSADPDPSDLHPIRSQVPSKSRVCGVTIGASGRVSPTTPA